MQLDMTEVTKVYQGGLTAGGATPDRSISACSPGSLIKGSGTIHGDVMQATGRASRSQLGALRARRVHRLERLVEPTNLTAGGIALWVGLHQQPARAILRDSRVVTLVIVAHRGNTASDAGEALDRAFFIAELPLAKWPSSVRLTALDAGGATLGTWNLRGCG
jgi:hypothetical protein